MKITIIGAGNMGGAIARGFAAKKVFAAKDITCCDRSDATLEALKKERMAHDMCGCISTRVVTRVAKWGRL